MSIPVRRNQEESEKVIDYQFIRSIKNKEVRKSRFKRTLSQRIFRVFLCCLLILEMAYLGFIGWRGVRDSRFFTLNNVEITGVRQADMEEIRRLVRSGQRNALTADLTQIKLILENHPWIRSAVIWRELPGTIRVHIHERKPVAMVLAGNLYLVDEAGRVIRPLEDPSDYSELPILSGIPEISNEQQIRSALAFVSAVSDPGILSKISEFHYYDTYNTIIYLKGYPFGLLVSKNDILPMVKKFMNYSEFLKENFSGQKWIDLRYQGQIIIKDAYREQL